MESCLLVLWIIPQQRKNIHDVKLKTHVREHNAIFGKTKPTF